MSPRRLQMAYQRLRLQAGLICQRPDIWWCHSTRALVGPTYTRCVSRRWLQLSPNPLTRLIFFQYQLPLHTHCWMSWWSISADFKISLKSKENLEAGEITLPLPCLSRVPFFPCLTGFTVWPDKSFLYEPGELLLLQPRWICRILKENHGRGAMLNINSGLCNRGSLGLAGAGFSGSFQTPSDRWLSFLPIVQGYWLL